MNIEQVMNFQNLFSLGPKPNIEKENFMKTKGRKNSDFTKNYYNHDLQPIYESKLEVLKPQPSKNRVKMDSVLMEKKNLISISEKKFRI